MFHPDGSLCHLTEPVLGGIIHESLWPVTLQPGSFFVMAAGNNHDKRPIDWISGAQGDDLSLEAGVLMSWVQEPPALFTRSFCSSCSSVSLQKSYLVT